MQKLKTMSDVTLAHEDRLNSPAWGGDVCMSIYSPWNQGKRNPRTNVCKGDDEEWGTTGKRSWEVAWGSQSQSFINMFHYMGKETRLQNVK